MAVRFGGSGGGITALTIGVGATTIVGGAANRILFEDSTGTTIAQSVNLTFGDTQLAAGPGVAIGTGGTTSAGWNIGYGGATGQSGIWSTTVGTPSGANYSLLATSTITSLSGLSIVNIQTAGGTKASFDTNAGSGPSFTMGTATTDVGLRATQTWNNAAVTFSGWKFTITDTASAAGSLAMQILGGAAGATNLVSVAKDGSLALGADTIYDATNKILTLPNQYRMKGQFFSAVSGTIMGWTNSTIDPNPALEDSAFSRISAGLIGVGTGAAGSTAGSLSMNNCTAVSYTVGTTAGLASFSGAVTNITVVNGIVTAAS